MFDLTFWKKKYKIEELEVNNSDHHSGEINKFFVLYGGYCIIPFLTEWQYLQKYNSYKDAYEALVNYANYPKLISTTLFEGTKPT